MGGVNYLFNSASVAMNSIQSAREEQLRRQEAELAADNLETLAARKELEAEEALKIGQLKQSEQILRGRQAIETKRADYAASGVRVDSGSTLEVAADMAAWSEYDRQKIQYSAELESWGLQYDAAMLRKEAANTRAAGAVSSGYSLGGVISTGSKLHDLLS